MLSRQITLGIFALCYPPIKFILQFSTKMEPNVFQVKVIGKYELPYTIVNVVSAFATEQLAKEKAYAISVWNMSQNPLLLMVRFFVMDISEVCKD